ncbi:MAG: hypothetical protein H8D47_02995 [Planctomycetes bacterium]|nr:hypothetical protein [Planctomycetota bacterium]
MRLSRSKAGDLLYYIGILGLPLGVGAALGFYAGAWGMRWLPTMLEIFLMVCIVSLLAIIGGRLLEGSVRKVTSKGLRLRRRVVTSIVFVSLVILARLGVYWVKQPSPLTELSPAKFNMVYETDMRNYFEYDKGIQRHLTTLEEYSKQFGADKSRILTANEEKLLRDIWTTIYDYAFALDQIHSFYEDWYRFDPSRIHATYHHRSFLLALAAELSLYEKSTRFIKLATQYENVVKFLNTPHPEASLKSDSFSRFREQFQGTRDRGRIAAGKKYLLWMEKGLKGRKVIAEAGCSGLWEKVEFELALIDQSEPIELAGLTVKSDIGLLKRHVGRIWFNGQRGVARWMGNTRIKRIGTYLITERQRQEMDKRLEPGDILLSRKNWYLSNVGLPGFWPHAILYLGSPDKFENYFNEIEVLAYIREISGEKLTFCQYLDKTYPAQWLTYQLGSDGKEYCVIEGLSDGVILNTMKATCGDYMAAIRPRLSKKAKAQAILKAFSHLGKPYDYNFDFATDHALVCTELVWRSYRPADGKRGLKIPLVEIAGRKTLPANEIAKLFATEDGKDDAQLDFVYFLDAAEKTEKTFFSTKEDFLMSSKRVKWSFALN